MITKSMITPEYLAELRKLTDAATPGPWDAEYRSGDIAVPAQVSEDEWEAFRLATFTCDGDAKFAAATRTAIPALLDHIEKLDKHTDELESDYHEALKLALDDRDFYRACCLCGHVNPKLFLQCGQVKKSCPEISKNGIEDVEVDNRWTPVVERLPEAWLHVPGVDSKGYIFTVYYDENSEVFNHVYSNDAVAFDIVQWRELPRPTQEVK